MGNGDVKCRNVCIFLPCLTNRTTIRIKLINPNKGQTKTRIVLSGFHVSPLSGIIEPLIYHGIKVKKQSLRFVILHFGLKLKIVFASYLFW